MVFRTVVLIQGLVYGHRKQENETGGPGREAERRGPVLG